MVGGRKGTKLENVERKERRHGLGSKN